MAKAHANSWEVTDEFWARVRCKAWISSERSTAVRQIGGAAMTYVRRVFARLNDCLYLLAEVWFALATDRNRCKPTVQHELAKA